MPSTRARGSAWSTDVPLRRTPTARDDRPAVRDLGGDFRDLPADSRRRPRRPDSGAAPQPRPDRRDQARVGLRQAGLCPVRQDYGEGLLGALMNYCLGFKWKIFPNGAYVPFFSNPVQWFYPLIMPWTALSLLFIGIYSRVLRSNILDSMNEDYVRTARAKGLSERRVLVKHVLRNSLVPIISLWGLDFGAVLGGGAILTETVFDLKGVGQYAAQSVSSLDVPPVLAITMFGAFFIVLLNTIVDITYAALDPRVRLTGWASRSSR